MLMIDDKSGHSTCSPELVKQLGETTVCVRYTAWLLCVCVCVSRNGPLFGLGCPVFTQKNNFEMSAKEPCHDIILFFYC